MQNVYDLGYSSLFETNSLDNNVTTGEAATHETDAINSTPDFQHPQEQADELISVKTTSKKADFQVMINTQEPRTPINS